MYNNNIFTSNADNINVIMILTILSIVKVQNRLQYNVKACKNDHSILTVF